MKKLARLREVERTFGPEYVLPYQACTDWLTLRNTIHDFNAAGHKPSLRTDTPGEGEQGLLLPFIHPVTEEAAEAVWREYGSKLVYIVCEGVAPSQTKCNATALRLTPTLLLVEYDEGNCAQRAWEHTRQPLRSAFCDKWGGWWQPIQPWGLVRVVPPKALPARTAIEHMYELLLAVPDPTTVWTVAHSGRIVVW